MMILLLTAALSLVSETNIEKGLDKEPRHVYLSNDPLDAIDRCIALRVVKYQRPYVVHTSQRVDFIYGQGTFIASVIDEGPRRRVELRMLFGVPSFRKTVESCFIPILTE